MKKIIIWTVMISLLSIIAQAQVNLDFRLNVDDRLYYPNETIPLNVSILNRDVLATARDANLLVTIGDKKFSYGLGDLKPNEKYSEFIELLPLFSGTQNVKGVLKYKGLFDEEFKLETYTSFEVLFPELERVPKNVKNDAFIDGNDLVLTLINHEGKDVNLNIKVKSLGKQITKSVSLKSNEEEKLNFDISNLNKENVQVEIYAVINSKTYIIGFISNIASASEEEIANETEEETAEEEPEEEKKFVESITDVATGTKNYVGGVIKAIEWKVKAKPKEEAETSKEEIKEEKDEINTDEITVELISIIIKKVDTLSNLKKKSSILLGFLDENGKEIPNLYFQIGEKASIKKGFTNDYDIKISVKTSYISKLENSQDPCPIVRNLVHNGWGRDFKVDYKFLKLPKYRNLMGTCGLPN